MRNKFFLFIIAAFMATSLWAENATGTGDTIPLPRYLKNIHYDKNTDKLYFDDTFQYGTRIKRRYDVIVLSYCK